MGIIKNTPSKKVLILCCLVTLALFLPGCRPAQMSIPTTLQSSSRIMEVSGRQNLSFDEPFSITPYKVTDVSRGWKRNTEWGVLMWGSSNADQSVTIQRIRKKRRVSWKCNCSECFSFVRSGSAIIVG